MPDDNERMRELVAEVAAAYFANSNVSVDDISKVIEKIASGLAAVGGATAPGGAAAEDGDAGGRKLTPAQIRKSITPDGLISFEDGRPYKILKRHLTTKGLTIEAYRAKWGLPSDYPTTAQNYSEARSAMAKRLGLGRKGGVVKKGRKT